MPAQSVEERRLQTLLDTVAKPLGFRFKSMLDPQQHLKTRVLDLRLPSPDGQTVQAVGEHADIALAKNVGVHVEVEQVHLSHLQTHTVCGVKVLRWQEIIDAHRP